MRGVDSCATRAGAQGAQDSVGLVGATFILYAEQSGSAAEPEPNQTKPKRRIASAGG